MVARMQRPRWELPWILSRLRARRCRRVRKEEMAGRDGEMIELHNERSQPGAKWRKERP